MANHSFIHFPRKVTCAQVADYLNEFMANRYAGLGHVETFTDTQNVSVSVFFKLFEQQEPIEYYYWSRSPRVIEYRPAHDMSFDFGSQILSYIGWKLNATHMTSEGLNEKMNLALFLTSQRISSMNRYRSFPEMPDFLLQHVKEIDQTLNLALLNERNFMHPQNMQDMTFFPFEEHEHSKHIQAYREKVSDIVKPLDFQAIDCFYGDTLHLALARSQLYYARELIRAGFPVCDQIDFSECDVPGHINQGFIEQFHTTLVHTLLLGLGTYSYTPLSEIKNTLTLLYEAGASFTAPDQFGQTPIDILARVKYAGERKVREELSEFMAEFFTSTPKR